MDRRTEPNNSSYKIGSNRFDQIDSLINITRLSIIEKNKRLQNLKMEGYAAQRLLFVVVEQVVEIITHLQEIESLYLALKDLAIIRLSHHFVETEILQGHLDILKK